MRACLEKSVATNVHTVAAVSDCLAGVRDWLPKTTRDDHYERQPQPMPVYCLQRVMLEMQVQLHLQGRPCAGDHGPSAGSCCLKMAISC